MAFALDGRPHAFDEHQRSDDAQEHDVGYLDDDVDLAGLTQERKQPDTEGRSDDTTDQQHDPHLEIDITAPPMGDDPGN